MVPWIVGSLLAGLGNALILSWQRRAREQYGRKIFCFLGQDCDAVVLSQYGTTLGMPNERLWVYYYIAAFILLALHTLADSYFALGLLAFCAFTAVMFSGYLLVVQAAILKQYCSWYIAATGIHVLLLSFILLL